jgi:hypothetical protein
VSAPNRVAETARVEPLPCINGARGSEPRLSAGEDTLRQRRSTAKRLVIFLRDSNVILVALASLKSLIEHGVTIECLRKRQCRAFGVNAARTRD